MSDERVQIDVVVVDNLTDRAAKILQRTINLFYVRPKASAERTRSKRNRTGSRRTKQLARR